MGQALGNLSQEQSIVQKVPVDSSLELTDIITLIEEAETILDLSRLLSTHKRDGLRYLANLKEVVQEDNVNKDLVVRQVEKLANVLEKTDDTLVAGQSILEKVKPILSSILTGLGLVSKFII